jgi:hypothetical protein
MRPHLGIEPSRRFEVAEVTRTGDHSESRFRHRVVQLERDAQR